VHWNIWGANTIREAAFRETKFLERNSNHAGRYRLAKQLRQSNSGAAAADTLFVSPFDDKIGISVQDVIAGNGHDYSRVLVTGEDCFSKLL
tara:strand:+ start:1501 stop:1773 length:273 start_codon:yes stop_codon:yes gene_type:complete